MKASQVWPHRTKSYPPVLPRAIPQPDFFSTLLERFGGQVTAYRVVYGGELQGRVLVAWTAATTAERAEMLERARQEGIADNPYLKATNAANPPLTTYSRIMFRSVEPDLPPPPQMPMRIARVFTAAPGHRAEVEEAARIGRAAAAEVGYEGYTALLENAGANSDGYVAVVGFNSWLELEDFEQKNAARAHAPGGYIDLFARGILTSVNRRVDYAFDLGR